MDQNLDTTLAAHWTRLADQKAPRRPTGPVGRLANRILTYTPPTYLPAVLPHLDPDTGGVVVIGAPNTDHARWLTEHGYDGPFLLDPATYQHYTATPDAPFWQPDGQLFPLPLTDTLDQQLRAGARVTLTPTGYIRAGDLPSLQAAARIVRHLDRRDVVFVVPIDVSLLDTAFIHDVIAILTAADCPIGLVLGGRDEPLGTAADRIVPNLRALALSVDLMPLRTDFTAFDLLAHGAFAAAIGATSRWHRAVDPTTSTPPLDLDDADDEPPSVLFTELLCWWPGPEIARLYGPQESTAYTCHCAVCCQRRLTRLVKPTHREEAVAHGVAIRSPYTIDLLGQDTMRGRAEYWRTLCASTVDEYGAISKKLKLRGQHRLQPPAALQQWATLPAWPLDTSTPAT